MKNKILNLIKIFILFVTVFTATGISFAWYSRVYSPVESTVTFDSTGTPPFEFEMWTFQTNQEKNNAASNAIANSASDAGTWIRQGAVDTQNSYGDMSIQIMSPISNGSVSSKSCTINLKDLQLGTVNNLYKNRRDNVMYMRFHISDLNIDDDYMYDSSTGGRYIRFSASYPEENYVHVYKDKWLTESDTITLKQGLDSHEYHILDSLRQLNDDNSFLEISYLLTETRYDSPDSFHSMIFEAITDQLENGINTDLTDYYLYVRIKPRVETIGKAMRYLYKVSPCTVLLDVRFEIEVQ